MSDQTKWLELVNNASANVKAARLLDADWPAGTLEQADAALDAALGSAPVPGPPPNPHPPSPPTPQAQGFGGTYGPEHGYAFDWYPNGELGPHYGYLVDCPANGTVEKYSIMVGKNKELEVTLVQGNKLKLLQELPYFLTPYEGRIDQIGASPMYICVFTPDQPVMVDGYRVVRFWFGHVQDGFATGKRKQGDLMFRCGNSGIAMLPGEASHIHCCASATGSLTPNGDVPGSVAVRWLGFNPRVIWVPGPAHYASGGYFRGKARG